jgi:pyruvate,orthophosphate dikinase
MADESKFVYEFSEGTKDMKDLLGGKGSGLAGMSSLDLPVPPGFIITTEACQAYMARRAARRSYGERY